MEFIRGKYDTRDKDFVKRQLQNMTVQEQNLIVSERFETLWTKLWGNGRDMDGPEYEMARIKFNTVDRRSLVSSVRSQFNEPEWGFPKGRRMRGESDVDCAIRECFEETNIPRAAFTVREDLTFTETFTGTNNICYKHVYFVVLLKDSKFIDLSQKFTPSQRREISSIGWKTLAECKNITRPHYVERKQMISELERILSLASK
jgi:8-oxo-dGTP pyrophosphatase MutT (NUDIX family)